METRKLSLSLFIAVSLGLIAAGCGGGGSGGVLSVSFPAPTGVSLTGANNRGQIFLSDASGNFSLVSGLSSTGPFTVNQLYKFTGTSAAELLDFPTPELLAFNGPNGTYGQASSTGVVPNPSGAFTFLLVGTPSNIRVRTDGVFYLSSGNIWEYNYGLKQNIEVRSLGDCKAFDVDNLTNGNTHVFAEVVNDPTPGSFDFDAQTYTVSGATYTAGAYKVLLGPAVASAYTINGCTVSQDGSTALLGYQQLVGPSLEGNLTQWTNITTNPTNSVIYSNSSSPSMIQPLAYSPDSMSVVCAENVGGTVGTYVLIPSSVTNESILPSTAPTSVQWANSTGTDF